MHIRTINPYETETLTKARNCKAQTKNVISKNDLSLLSNTASQVNLKEVNINEPFKRKTM